MLVMFWLSKIQYFPKSDFIIDPDYSCTKSWVELGTALKFSGSEKEISLELNLQLTCGCYTLRAKKDQLWMAGDCKLDDLLQG